MTMNLNTLKDIPPWEWPDDAGETLLGVLRDDGSLENDLLLAIELAGEVTVINDELVAALLSILERSDKSPIMRGTAAIALGPVLEYADTEGFEEADIPITERTFHRIQETLRRIHLDASVAEEVRRRALEASVRASQDWHHDAIRAAFLTGDEAWRLTAVFCMAFVRGFEAEILAALDDQNPEIRYEAVVAAGNWEIDAAWSHIAALITAEEVDKRLLLAAIGAVATVRPHDAPRILADLMESDDEDIVEAVDEALAMGAAFAGEDDESEE